jgi:hypothetical protein
MGLIDIMFMLALCIIAFLAIVGIVIINMTELDETRKILLLRESQEG